MIRSPNRAGEATNGIMDTPPASMALAVGPEGRAVPRAAPAIDAEAIYDEHVDFVWRALYRLGAPAPTLEDAVQDVFLVVHRRLRDFEGRSSMRTWLFSIAMRVAKDHRRTLRRRGSIEPLDERLVDTGADPGVEVERARALEALSEILDGLDDERRAVFVMAELEQMSVREMAEVLSANPNTISSRLRAARADFDRAVARYRARSR